MHTTYPMAIITHHGQHHPRSRPFAHMDNTIVLGMEHFYCQVSDGEVANMLSTQIPITQWIKMATHEAATSKSLTPALSQTDFIAQVKPVNVNIRINGTWEAVYSTYCKLYMSLASHVIPYASAVENALFLDTNAPHINPQDFQYVHTAVNAEIVPGRDCSVQLFSELIY